MVEDRLEYTRALLEAEIKRLRHAKDPRLMTRLHVLEKLCLPLLDLWAGCEASTEFDPFATGGIVISSVTSLLKALLTPEYEHAPADEVNLVLKHHIDRVFPHGPGGGFLENSALN